MHKWSPNCPWLIWVHFWAIFWPSLTPPGNTVKIFGQKWLVHCTGIPHVVLYYMFDVQLAPLGGIFGPLKSNLGVFWTFPATDCIMGILKIWDNFLGPNGPILKFTFSESLRNLWLFGINKKDGFFFGFGPLQDPCDILTLGKLTGA